MEAAEWRHLNMMWRSFRGSTLVVRIEKFFRRENQACPPALSNGRNIYLGTKSNLLAGLEEFWYTQYEAPVTSSVVLDG